MEGECGRCVSVRVDGICVNVRIDEECVSDISSAVGISSVWNEDSIVYMSYIHHVT